MNCLLCGSKSNIFEDEYFQCNHCGLIFKDPKNFLDSTQEYSRYQFHHNDVHDEGYVNFLKKLIDPIKDQLKSNTTHLDFGSGKKSWYQEYLKKENYLSEVYDLYFYPNKNVLNKKYDLITCSEVVEHFQKPDESLELLFSLVEEHGYLAIMTSLVNEEVNFKNWWYKNDPTHVVFYTEKTMNYLASKYQYKIVFNDHKSVVVLKKESV